MAERRYVIATDNTMAPADRDEDDTATLFWNVDDGFGDLGSATVFTAEESREVDLPIADDQPIWVALPNY